MSKKVELVLSNTYVYRGKVFERNGGPYVVSDSDGNHLLAQRNERDIPYFRLSEAEGAVTPPDKRSDKGGASRPAPEEVEAEAEAESVVEEPAAEEDDSDAVTV